MHPCSNNLCRVWSWSGYSKQKAGDALYLAQDNFTIAKCVELWRERDGRSKLAKIGQHLPTCEQAQTTQADGQHTALMTVVIINVAMSRPRTLRSREYSANVRMMSTTSVLGWCQRRWTTERGDVLDIKADDTEVKIWW